MSRKMILYQTRYAYCKVSDSRGVLDVPATTEKILGAFNGKVSGDKVQQIISALRK